MAVNPTQLNCIEPRMMLEAVKFVSAESEFVKQGFMLWPTMFSAATAALPLRCRARQVPESFAF